MRSLKAADKLMKPVGSSSGGAWLTTPAPGHLNPGRAVRNCLKQVEAVRHAFGDDLEILIDVHTRLDPADSLDFCNKVAQYNPFFIEDPLRAENPASLRRLRQQTSVPIAVGEQFDSKWTFREVIEEDLMDYCRVDLCIAGGLTEARKIAGWCETHYIYLAPHNPLGPVSAAACLHLSLSSALLGVQELPRAPMSSLTDVFPVQMPFEAGYLLPPRRSRTRHRIQRGRTCRCLKPRIRTPSRLSTR